MLPFLREPLIVGRPDRSTPYGDIARMLAEIVVTDWRDGDYELLEDNTLAFHCETPDVL